MKKPQGDRTKRGYGFHFHFLKINALMAILLAIMTLLSSFGTAVSIVKNQNSTTISKPLVKEVLSHTYSFPRRNLLRMILGLFSSWMV